MTRMNASYLMISRKSKKSKEQPFYVGSSLLFLLNNACLPYKAEQSENRNP